MDVRKKVFSERVVVHGLPRGKVGVTIPGGVQETWRCGTKECGLVDNIGGRRVVELNDPRGLSQPQ